MESNNYIRKIDEFGRIVIPKEVRSKLKIQDNENIIININKNLIEISKYSYLTNYQKFINFIGNEISEIYKIKLSIESRDEILFTNIEEENILYKENIIKDSIIIGSININNNNPEIIKMIKYTSRIISEYISNT